MSTLVFAEADRVTPESSEGRERITRLEERVESNKRQIEMLGPLPLQVGLVQRGQEDLREDLHDFERRMEVRLERFERSVQAQVSACADQISQMQKGGAEAKTSDKASRRAMWGLVGAAAVTGLLGLITQLITALT
jgi:hypothetical protein